METKDSRINRAVAAQIKGARVAAGLTIEELSRLTDIPVGTLNRMSSKDIRDINVTQLAAISRAVKVPVGELMRRAEEMAGNADSFVSEASDTPNDIATKRKQKEVAAMTPQQIQDITEKAATYDPERETTEDDTN